MVDYMTPALVKLMGDDFQVVNLSSARDGFANYSMSQRVASGLSDPEKQKILVNNLNYEFTKNLKKPITFTSTFENNELKLESTSYTFTFKLSETPAPLRVQADFPIRTLVPSMLFRSILAAVDGMNLDPKKKGEKAASTEIEKQKRGAITEALEKRGITQSSGPLKQILQYADIKPLPKGTGRRRRKQKKTRRSRR